MFDYFFTRELIDGRYNIDNIDRVIGENQLHLFTEIKTALPGNDFKIICNGSDVKISFVSELSSGDQTTLDNVITAHKNNT